MNILVSGSLAYDKIMDFPGKFVEHILPEKIHNINVSFFINELTENFGGTAGNIAYNLAALGEDPVLISTAGNDFEKYKEWLLAHNIDIKNIKIISTTPTAVATIITDRGDNQIAAFYPGALATAVAAYPKEADLAIISPGNTEDMAGMAGHCKENNIPYIFDPGQQIPALSKNEIVEALNGANIFISNDYELALVLKKTDLTEEELLSNVEMLVTTLGEKGSLIKTKESVFSIPPAKPKSIKDPTGAGDAYRAGLIYGINKRWPIEVSGRFASLVSCYVVELYGTQAHKFNYEELNTRYKENFGEFLPKEGV